MSRKRRLKWLVKKRLPYHPSFLTKVKAQQAEVEDRQEKICWPCSSNLLICSRCRWNNRCNSRTDGTAGAVLADSTQADREKEHQRWQYQLDKDQGEKACPDVVEYLEDNPKDWSSYIHSQ